MSTANEKTLQVNGNTVRYAANSFPVSALELVNNLKLTPEKVVMELNGAIIKNANLASQQLQDGDKIELVSFVGGG
jgi:thiamine biosynthesis protein ThiS